MHHTDYSKKLRIASRKSTKNLPHTVTSTPVIEDRSTHLHRAVVAAVLVIVAILQMDPANAEPTMSVLTAYPMGDLPTDGKAGWQ